MKVEWKSCFKVGVSLFLLYLGITYWGTAIKVGTLMFSAAAPLLIGCVIAYLVNILMSCYERHYFRTSSRSWVVKSRRPVCMLAAFVTLLAVVLLIIGLILPQLWSCTEILLSGIPAILQETVEIIGQYELLPEDVVALLEAIDWRSKIGELVQVVTSNLGNVMDVLITTVTSVFSGVVSALLSVIFSIYILLGKEKLGCQFQKLTHRYLKETWVHKLNYVLSVVNDCFHKYIVGQCTEAVIIGTLCAAGMVILQLPYATMIGALVAFTALIPVAGAYIGALVGAFMILTVSPVQALIFLVFLVVLQQLEGNIIYPRVVGSSLGLPAIWVLAAVTMGGGVMGVAGMLLGVPLMAAAYRMIRDDVNSNS